MPKRASACLRALGSVAAVGQGFNLGCYKLCLRRAKASDRGQPESFFVDAHEKTVGFCKGRRYALLRTVEMTNMHACGQSHTTGREAHKTINTLHSSADMLDADVETVDDRNIIEICAMRNKSELHRCGDSVQTLAHALGLGCQLSLPALPLPNVCPRQMPSLQILLCSKPRPEPGMLDTCPIHCRGRTTADHRPCWRWGRTERDSRKFSKCHHLYSSTCTCATQSLCFYILLSPLLG